MRKYVPDPLDAAGAERRDLRAVPPLLHGEAEADGHGRPTPVEPRSIADGLSAPFAGRIALDVCRDVELATVTEEEIEDAFRFLYERAKLACEPAGAVAAVVSGGNVAAETAAAILAGR